MTACGSTSFCQCSFWVTIWYILGYGDAYYNYFLVFYGTNFHERTPRYFLFKAGHREEWLSSQHVKWISSFLFSNKFLTNENKPKPASCWLVQTLFWKQAIFNIHNSNFDVRQCELLDVLPKTMITELFVKTYYSFTF